MRDRFVPPETQHLSSVSVQLPLTSLHNRDWVDWQLNLSVKGRMYTHRQDRIKKAIRVRWGLPVRTITE